jgi:hypothetical protein
MRVLGANLGATRANNFPRQADEHGQAAGDHARSRTGPDVAERDAGIYGSEASCSGWAAQGFVSGNSQRLVTISPRARTS